MKLFVACIPRAIDEGELFQLFARHGDVVDVKIITDRETGEHKGFGFVTFSNAGDARQAIEALNGACLYGRDLVVTVAEDRPRGMREAVNRWQ